MIQISVWKAIKLTLNSLNNIMIKRKKLCLIKDNMKNTIRWEMRVWITKENCKNSKILKMIWLILLTVMMNNFFKWQKKILIPSKNLINKVKNHFTQLILIQLIIKIFLVLMIKENLRVKDLKRLNIVRIQKI